MDKCKYIFVYLHYHVNPYFLFGLYGNIIAIEIQY